MTYEELKAELAGKPSSEVPKIKSKHFKNFCFANSDKYAWQDRSRRKPNPGFERELENACRAEFKDLYDSTIGYEIARQAALGYF